VEIAGFLNSVRRAHHCITSSSQGCKMKQDTFMEILAREGFMEWVTVTREASGFLGMHTHPFEAKALVLRGGLRLRVGDEDQFYRAGEVFHLPAGEPHSEWYGPEGVTYLVGRR
jgi:quercetin dioxygenase-like cupin family protein